MLRFVRRDDSVLSHDAVDFPEHAVENQLVDDLQLREVSRLHGFHDEDSGLHGPFPHIPGFGRRAHE